LILAITNVSTSYLSTHADITLDILAGSENHAPSKTYINTIATLLLLYSYTITGPDSGKQLATILLKIAQNIANKIPKFKKWAEEVARLWAECTAPIQYLALGPQIASAWQSAMLTSETARVLSSTIDWATFRHGFEPAVNEGFFAIGFKPIGPNSKVWNTTRKSILNRKGQINIVPQLFSRKDIPEEEFHYLGRDVAATIWETLPIHWLCIELARYKGLEASKIERKVTLDL
jgi:glucosamine 6-phosphate synthetase-like amidotransferase/phosphosugar isomerase protein